MTRPLVIYHAGCWDGFCAAWIAHKKFGDDADYFPAHHGTDPPDVEGRRVWILDFSYKAPVLAAMAKRAAQVVLLDHHKTAEADLKALPSLYDGSIPSTRLIYRFDMEMSGGRLTWEEFFRKQPVPWLVDYTEDRDLWRWKLPCSREINAALRSLPLDFTAWDLLEANPDAPRILTVEGAAILRREKQIIDDHVGFAREIDMDGHKILAVNATVLVSEIAGELAQGRPFGACYFIRSDGKRVWSLRSREGGIDVSEVAKRRGGGGHRNAAGFEESP